MSVPIPLIYITSNGLSGSTLLDVLLGAHPQIWTLGEAMELPSESRNPTLSCGCGQRFPACPYWGPLLAADPALFSDDEIHRFREHPGSGKVLRLTELRRAWLYGAGPQSNQDAIDGFGAVNSEIAARCLVAAQAIKPTVRVLVDASKDPYRLRWLALSGRFELHALHITKDPRAYIDSLTRNRERPNARTLRGCLRYVVQNRVIERICRRTPLASWAHLRYEDLAASPAETLQAVLARIGLESAGYLPRLDGHGKNHGIAGAVIRAGSGEIRLNERWRDSLSPARQRLILGLTRGPARDYGYL
jgi:hypothetical protein